MNRRGPARTRDTVRARSRALALSSALLLVAGCDALTFTDLADPPAPPSRATIQVRYVHAADSLRGDLAVILEAWAAPGSDAPEVWLDTHALQPTDQEQSWVRFVHAWARIVGGADDLPQVLTLSAPAAAVPERPRLPLPVLLRTGPATLCVRAGDPVLTFQLVPGAATIPAGWHLLITSESEGVVLQGSGAPPDSVRIPRELLSSPEGPWRAELHLSLVRYRYGEPDQIHMTAQLAALWALVSDASGHPACAGTARHQTTE